MEKELIRGHFRSYHDVFLKDNSMTIVYRYLKDPGITRAFKCYYPEIRKIYVNPYDRILKIVWGKNYESFYFPEAALRANGYSLLDLERKSRESVEPDFDLYHFRNPYFW